ncbi:MAG: O-methyltransferase [bacterium]|nr:O-methyltransferase [bacterium]
MKFYTDIVTKNKMSELEKTQKDFWNISPETGCLINMFIKMINAKSALEIGTSNGYSGIWIAKALKQTGGKLTTIEYYEKRQKMAIENFKLCQVFDIIRPLQGDACSIIEAFSQDEKFDFVFIDANKSEYIKYFNLVKKHLADKALIIADNITSHPQKVQSFIDAVDADNDFQYEIIEIGGGFLIAYKI